MELQKCSHFLASLINTQHSLILRQFALNFAINLSDYLGSILSFIALAVPLFAGVYANMSAADLSQLISQNAFFTIYLINCFTRLIDLASNFSIFMGTSTRIGELLEWLEENTAQADLSKAVVVTDTYQNMWQEPESEFFKLTNVTIETPGAVSVVRHLNLLIKPGLNLLITGPSGVGKSSILRVIKNIWPTTEGRVERNLLVDDPSSVIFLPQKPILTTGCLAEVTLSLSIFTTQFFTTLFTDRSLSETIRSTNTRQQISKSCGGNFKISRSRTKCLGTSEWRYLS